MKRIFKTIGRYFTLLKASSDRKRVMNSLQRQRYLLRTGIQTIADVVEVERKGSRVNNLIEIKIALGIHKPDGQIILAESRSVISIEKMPVPGQKLQIWMIPQDTSFILIL